MSWLTIHSTERNLDLASTQNRIAEDKARELKSKHFDILNHDTT